MIEVKFQFNSVDEAIVALGKMVRVPAKAAAQAQEAQRTEQPASAPATTTRQRKPRADKGQQRGAYAPRAQDAGGDQGGTQPTGTVAAATPAASVPPPARVADATAAPTTTTTATPATVTREQAVKKLEEVFAKKQIGGALEVLARVGVQRLRDVPDNLLPKFMEAADETLAAA